jgi:hypothetical protein
MLLTALFLLAMPGCKEAAESDYNRGFQDGFVGGQFLVCQELERVAPLVKLELKSCHDI